MECMKQGRKTIWPHIFVFLGLKLKKKRSEHRARLHTIDLTRMKKLA